MQALGPPRNVIIWPQTPGTEVAASGTFSQRSGLRGSRVKKRNDDARKLDSLELHGIFAPRSFITVQGKKRNDHGLSLRDAVYDLD